MNVAAVQFDIAWEDRAANFARVRDLLGASPPAAGSLIVLPEMFASGFSMNLPVTRQTDAREDEMFLAGLAREVPLWRLLDDLPHVALRERIGRCRQE